MNQKTLFRLSKKGEELVKKEMSRYETKRSAVIPCLYQVQKENGGWVSSECVSYLSQLMNMSESYIYEVLTFYTLFNQKPVGTFHIQVCTNVSCAMNGSQKLVKALNTTLKSNQKTTCTISEVECLGSCDTAPVVQINREPYIEKATVEQVTSYIKTQQPKK